MKYGSEFDAELAPAHPRWEVVWNREKFVGVSAGDVMAQIASGSYTPIDRKYPKRGIAYRVFVQYAVMLDEDADDATFLMRLAEYGIVSVKITGERPRDVLAETLQFIAQWHGLEVEPDAQ